MAGTVTVTKTDVGTGTARFMRYVVSWVATAGGAVSANPFSVVPGFITQARYMPGVPAPTALYDATLVDTDNFDLLSGGGANRSATLPEVQTISPGIYQDGSRQLDVVIANAGNGGAGTLAFMVSTPIR